MTSVVLEKYGMANAAKFSHHRDSYSEIFRPIKQTIFKISPLTLEGL